MNDMTPPNDTTAHHRDLLAWPFSCANDSASRPRIPAAVLESETELELPATFADAVAENLAGARGLRRTLVGLSCDAQATPAERRLWHSLCVHVHEVIESQIAQAHANNELRA